MTPMTQIKQGLYVGIVVTVLLAHSASHILAQTPGTLTFSPSTTTKQTGEVFVTDVVVNTGGLDSGGTGVKIIYDPAVMQVTEIEAGEIYADYPAVVFDNQSGEITISGIVSSVNQLYNGSGVFARIFWKGVNPGTAIAQFEFEYGNTTDSNIAIMSGNGDGLGSVGSFTATITGNPLPPTPTVVPTATLNPGSAFAATPTPAPTQQPAESSSQTNSGGVVNTVNKLIGGLFGKQPEPTLEAETATQIGDDPTNNTQSAEDALYQPITRSKPNTSLKAEDRVPEASVTATTLETPGNSNQAVFFGILALAMIGIASGFAALAWHKRVKYKKQVIKL